MNLDLGFWQFAVLLFGTLLSSELLLRLPLRNYAKHLNHLFRRIFKMLRSSRISDHWKEQMILAYAVRLLSYSLILPILLLVALTPLIAWLWTVTDSIGDLFRLSLDWKLLISVTTLSLIYLFVRTRFHV